MTGKENLLLAEFRRVFRCPPVPVRIPKRSVERQDDNDGYGSEWPTWRISPVIVGVNGMKADQLTYRTIVS